MKAVWIIGFFLWASGCNPAKKIRTGAAEIGNEPTLPVNGRLLKKTKQRLSEGNEIPFETMAAKVKVEFEDINGKQPETNVFIRMQKNRFIWVSVTATFLNVEAARVMITPDSVVIVNKFDKTIEEHALGLVQERIGLPLTFDDLQKLIAGCIILHGDSVTSVSSGENFLRADSPSEGIENAVYFTLPAMLLARQSLSISTQNEKYTADILYENYEKSGDRYFSLIRNIIIPEKYLSTRLTFRQYEFNKELSAPFNRPDGYKIK